MEEKKGKQIIMIGVLVIIIIALAIILGVKISNQGKISNSTTTDTSTTLKDEIRRKVKISVMTRATLNYEGTATDASITTINISKDGTTATVYGKVSVRDNYGDTYTGKFSADVKINNGNISVEDVDIDTPTKNR